MSHELTVTLERSGASLLRRYHWPSYPNAAQNTCDPSVLGRDYSFKGKLGLEAIALLLDEGAEAALDENFTKSRLQRIGEILFELLFGDREEMTSLLRRRFGTAEPSPRRQPVRLRVCTSDPILGGLPYRLTAYQGHWLIDDGWTFEVTSLENAELAVSLHVPCKILVVAPRVPSLPELGTDLHLQSLREMLERISPQYREENLLYVARTRSELAGALNKFEPVVFYYYGHGDIVDRQACLILEGGARGDRMLLADVKMNLREPAPRIAYFNACKAGGGGWTSAGHQLSPAVPLVIAHRTTAWNDYAGEAAVSWLYDCLALSLDPLQRLHALPKEKSRRDFQWATTSAHASYSRWLTKANTLRRRNPEEGLRLDRAEQRSFVLSQVISEMPKEQFRVEAMIAYGASGNLVDKFGEQARDHLESHANHLVSINRVPLQFPAHRGDLENLLGVELMRCLQTAKYETLTDVLRRAAPERRGAKVSLLWLDWGVFGTALGRQPPLHTSDLEAWVSFCCNKLTPACHSDIRIISYLAIEAGEQSFGKIKNEVARLQLKYRRPLEFSFSLLPALPALELLHILQFLENPTYVSCPPGLVNEAAQLIHARAQGKYEETVELIKRAERTTWHQLLDSLRKEAGPAAAGDSGGLIT